MAGMDSVSATVYTDEPRSRLVDDNVHSQSFQLPETINSEGDIIPPPLPSPPLPPRSPLRGVTRRNTDASSTICSSLSIPVTPASEIETEAIMSLLESRSVATISTTLDPPPRRRKGSTPDKPLPRTPSSPALSIQDTESLVDTLGSGASTTSFLDTPVPHSKRVYALLELLSSERAYASDLTVIRDIHFTAALGQPVPLTPPPSSNGSSSSRAVSTASDASDPASSTPPMTVEDARIIFSNIGELAAFSDMFSVRLEEALGSTIEGRVGEDHVGALFLEMIPKMEPIYTLYITKHPAALEHLSSLPPSPSLAHYLSYTRELAQHLTHAWDLPSLLIKPVQRLLKYSLLLSAVIEETPDSHSDKPKLKEARTKIEAVAHGVNEGRRRREVVKEILTIGSTTSLVPTIVSKKSGDVKTKKKGLNMGMAAASSLARMKSTARPGSFKGDGNAEAKAVEEMRKRLEAYDNAILDYAKDVAKWSEALKTVMESLRSWTLDFGKLVGIEIGGDSPAFNAFIEVVEKDIFPSCDRLSHQIHEELLPQLNKLKETTAAPGRLLEAMLTLAPQHYTLLNTNVVKTRPTPALLDASRSYVALRSQLFTELPQYLQLLEQGVRFTVVKLMQWKVLFWDEVRSKWVELWDSLKLETESQGNAEETVKVWQVRHQETLALFDHLLIVRPPQQTKKEKDIDARKGRSRSKSHSLENGVAVGIVHSIAPVTAMLATLDPHLPPTPRSPNKPRSTHSQEVGPPLERRGSSESLRSKKSNKSTKGPKHRHTQSNGSIALYQQDESGSSFFDAMLIGLSPTKPAYNRAKSAPISSPMQLRRSTSQGKLLDTNDREVTLQRSNAHYHDLLGEEEVRGRDHQKPNIRRRVTDAARSSPTPLSRNKRSPSLPNAKGNHTPPSPAPNQTLFNHLQPQGPLPPSYSCVVVHNCYPPDGVQYQGIPFHTLEEGDVYSVIQECGHPSEHKDLPLRVDDGEDCLLLLKNVKGRFGWALASFLLPQE